MDTIDLDALLARAPLAEGYRLDLLQRHEVDRLIASLQAWYPDIGVGAASCFLRPDFYDEQVQVAGGPRRDVFVVLMRHGDALAGMFSWDIDRDTLSVYARLGVAAPDHRGTRLADAGLAVSEAVGRRIGAGLVYGMATLKTPYAQRAFERAGWQLIGITPGFDREMVAPGVIKRVYEAVYMKVLAGEADLLQPEHGNLTPRTRAFFERIFEARCACDVPALSDRP